MDGLHPARLGLEDGGGQRPAAPQGLHLVEERPDAGVLAEVVDDKSAARFDGNTCSRRSGF